MIPGKLYKNHRNKSMLLFLVNIYYDYATFFKVSSYNLAIL